MCDGVHLGLCIFFFKHNTAYEVRISDWSSDVCSSDLIHLHNTRGLGLANALAALDAGLTTLDASLGGIGGCPFAPGASGNIVTEDLVFMLEAMGLRTGIDIDRLLEVRAIVAAALPQEEMFGFLPDAKLPLGFAPAAMLETA